MRVDALLASLALVVSLASFGRPASAAPLPPGWSSQEAYDASLAAEDARAAGLWDRCIAKDTESIAKEDQTMTRVHLAGCADRAGQVLLALRQLQIVLDAAVAQKNAEVASLAKARVEQLLKRLGTLVLQISDESKNLTITLDDEALPPDRHKKPITVDPGKHRVHAEGVIDGAPGFFEEVVDVGPGERANVVIALRPRASEFLTAGQMACMQAAKTQEEVLACLPANKKALVARVALETSGYADTFSVMVLNPAVRASVVSPTQGWNVGASYLIDVISAASPDFVSTASPRGHDLRQAGTIDGGYKPGLYGFDAAVSYSTEADYVSRSGDLGVLGDFWDKRVTPRLGWSYSNDTVSRGGTPTSVFSHTLITNEGTASVAVVMSPTTLLLAGLTTGFERGDQSKPYRLIPMFADDVSVEKGASTDEVNAKRLPVRPYEQLPLERDRYALAARVAHRFATGTLRVEERLYDDTWQIRSTSTDARYLQDIGPSFTVGPHVRFHAQTGADFYQRVYHAELAPLVTVPVFRTTDRELGPLWSVTGGASLWWRPFGEQASPGWTFYVSGDVLSSHYLNSLYVTDRLAGYATIGAEVELE